MRQGTQPEEATRRVQSDPKKEEFEGIWYRSMTFFTNLDCFSCFFWGCFGSSHFFGGGIHGRKSEKPTRTKHFRVAIGQVIVDLKTAITLKPEARTKWLSKALLSWSYEIRIVAFVCDVDVTRFCGTKLWSTLQFWQLRLFNTMLIDQETRGRPKSVLLDSFRHVKSGRIPVSIASTVLYHVLLICWE